MKQEDHKAVDLVDRRIERNKLEDALKLLLKPRGKVRSENREPTREELSWRYKLERRNRKK